MAMQTLDRKIFMWIIKVTCPILNLWKTENPGSNRFLCHTIQAGDLEHAVCKQLTVLAAKSGASFSPPMFPIILMLHSPPYPRRLQAAPSRFRRSPKLRCSPQSLPGLQCPPQSWQSTPGTQEILQHPGLSRKHEMIVFQ